MIPTKAERRVLEAMADGRSYSAALSHLWERGAGVVHYNAMAKRLLAFRWIGPQEVLGVRTTLITAACRAALATPPTVGQAR